MTKNRERACRGLKKRCMFKVAVGADTNTEQNSENKVREQGRKRGNKYAEKLRLRDPYVLKLKMVSKA